jgi:hypothetical protein
MQVALPFAELCMRGAINLISLGLVIEDKPETCT